jgi:hypothetical protein
MLNRTILVRALALAFSAAALDAAVMPAAMAQSNTTGTIFGKVDNPAGATVVIENAATGFRRTMTPDANGRYNALSLPTGDYKVSLVRNGAVERSDEASVGIGAGVDVSFAAVSAVVKISGARNRIDVSNTNQGATFTSRELAKLPITPTVGAVIQLAAGTVKGDPGYGGANAPSFGGASGSENAFYINGFPVTNPLTQTGFSTLPFFAIQQAQILTGGYGAEFGRSTGGVVNVTSKRGTNRWEAGVAAEYEPNALRSSPHNIVYPQTGAAASGTVRQYLHDDREDVKMGSAYLAGPLIQDKLFAFLTVEQTRTTSQGVTSVNTDPAAATSGWERRTLTQPRALLKLDWNITDDHRLEYTMVRDTPKDHRIYNGYDYATHTHDNVVGAETIYRSYGPTPIAATTGGNLDILKYTGNLTNDLTVTALAGRTKVNREQNQVGYDPSFPLINVIDPAPGINYASKQPFADDAFAPGSRNKSSGYRLDLEYKVNAEHTVRAGLDNMKLNSFSGTLTSGGQEWNYDSTPCGDPISGVPGTVMAPTNLKSADGSTCYSVSSFKFKAVNPAKVDQGAQYIEDRWQITKDVLAVIGLRNESFKNYNEEGKAFITQNRQIEPRLAISWDVNGDSSTKVFANAGRYHLQMPANVSIRSGGASTYLQQYFSYTGVDPVTGAPTGTVALTPVFSPDGETGAPKDLNYVAAKDLKSHYQDEIAFGFEKAMSKQLNVGAKFTYRDLKSTLEDWCDSRPFYKWAADNHVGTDKLAGTGAFAANGPAFGCTIINPGRTNTWDLDIDGDGKTEHVVLTPLQMGGGESSRDGAALPKATRKYTALDMFAEHPFDGNWYGKLNYTWSRSKGNTEGQLNSDLQQADPATTVAFDFKELEEYASGYLPNDRTHVIKAFGYYALTKEFMVGANALLSSGRPRQCLGAYPDAADGAAVYGNLFHYCTAPGATDATPSPRGSTGRLPWTKTLDLDFSYRPMWASGLELKADVFNVFNSQTAARQRDINAPASRYQMITDYTAPRSVRFSAVYDMKF